MLHKDTDEKVEDEDRDFFDYSLRDLFCEELKPPAQSEEKSQETGFFDSPWLALVKTSIM